MLIAEIGNNHQGNLETFKLMILRAKECGANIVKAQAISPDTIKGSMPKEFYEQCALTKEQYEDAIKFANNINIPLFYSVFDSELNYLIDKCGWLKIAGGQFKTLSDAGVDLKKFDDINSIISVPYGYLIEDMKHAMILHVTDYLAENPYLKKIDLLKQLNIHVGYSDHTVGIENCVKAVVEHGAEVVEKHFVLNKDKGNIYFNNQLFRDSVHAADEDELKELAGVINDRKNEKL